MTNLNHFDPIDKTTINTKLRIHPDLFRDPNKYTQDRDLTTRTVKQTRGNGQWSSAQMLTIDMLRYKGIRVELSKIPSEPLTKTTIHFNPSVCLYGHNGTVVTLSEFLDAIGLLVTNLRLLLDEPTNWFDIVPGVRDGGRAYWSYIEALFQFDDPDGSLLNGFRDLRHPKKNVPTRHWPESIHVGGDRSKLAIAIYRKAVEMRAHNKLSDVGLNDYRHILRLEARMKESKLLEYLGNERNIEVIDGKERLVRFYPHEIVESVRKVFDPIQGVYSSTEPPPVVGTQTQLEPLGRWPAQVAMDQRTSLTFHELLAHLKFYTKASSDTVCKIRSAGLAELSRHSSIKKEDLFSDAACQAQHGIANPDLEQKVCYEDRDIFRDLRITAAYCPPTRHFTPMIEWPTYIRV